MIQPPAPAAEMLINLLKSIRRFSGSGLVVGILIVTLSSLFSNFVVNHIPLIKIAESHFSDIRISLLTLPRQQSKNIAVVLITEDTLAKLPYRSPLDRSMIADLLKQLESRSVAAIGLNVIFDRPTEAEKDNHLFEVLRSIDVPVIVPTISNMAGFTTAQMRFSKHYLQGLPTGLSQIYRDPLDYTVREFLLRHIRGRSVQLGFAAAIASAIGVDLPVKERPRIDFRASPDLETPAFPVYAAHEVADLPVAALKNRVVLIGSDLGQNSRHRTPLSAQHTAAELYMPGVLIEAHVLSQLIEGRSLDITSETENLILLVAAALLGVLISMVRLKWIFKIALSFGILPIAWIAALVIYIYEGLLVPMIATTIAYLIAAVAGFLWEWRNEFNKRQQVHQAFGQFLAPAVIDQMLLDPESLELGGEIREVTFLFTDLEGFTALTENNSPQVMVRLVNAYLEESCQIVIQHGGTIDKIVGDALHVMFNAPVHQEDHPQRAVECALALNEWSNEFRERQAALGTELGRTRIGVNTGKCMVGNFGGSVRFDYTAHGDAINTAARLESINQRLGTTICISESTASRCSGINFLPVATLVLYGKTQGVNVFYPCTENQDLYDDSFREAYKHAFSCLRDDKIEAPALFRELFKQYPDHPLVALHSVRIAGDETGINMVMRKK